MRAGGGLGGEGGGGVVPIFRDAYFARFLDVSPNFKFFNDFRGRGI